MHRCNLCLYHVAFSLCLCPNFLLLLRAPVIGFRATLTQSDLILTWWHLQRPYFQIRPQSQVPGVRTTTYLFRRHNSTHNKEGNWVVIFFCVCVINRTYTWNTLILEVPSKNIAWLVVTYLTLTIPMVTHDPLQVFLVVIHLYVASNWPMHAWIFKSTLPFFAVLT